LEINSHFAAKHALQQLAHSATCNAPVLGIADIWLPHMLLLLLLLLLPAGAWIQFMLHDW
jgi:hypothetical protein